MGSIKISDLQPDKVLNRDIFYDGGPIFSRGDQVSAAQLAKLRDWGIETGEIEGAITSIDDLYTTAGPSPRVSAPRVAASAAVQQSALPEGSFLDPEQTTYQIRKSLAGVDCNVQFDKNLEIIGNIENGPRVEVDGNLTVKGYIQDAFVISGETMTVEGGINGMSTSWIEARHLKCNYIIDADVKVQESITVSEIKGGKVIAGDSIDCSQHKGSVSGASLEAGDRLTVKIIGNKESAPVEAIIRNDKMKKWVSDLLELENLLREDLPKFKRLEKLIMVIKTMGDKVRTLPPDKREQLAIQSKLYFELKKKMEDAENRRKDLDIRIRKRKAKGYCSVVVINEVYPGVKIEIAGASTLITSPLKFCGFYLKEGKVLVQTNPDLSVE